MSHVNLNKMSNLMMKTMNMFMKRRRNIKVSKPNGKMNGIITLVQLFNQTSKSLEHKMTYNRTHLNTLSYNS